MDNTQIKIMCMYSYSNIAFVFKLLLLLLSLPIIWFFFGILHISSFPFSLYWCVKSDDDGHQIHDVHDEDNTHWQRKIISYLFLDWLRISMNGCVVELMTTQAGPYEISTIFIKIIGVIMRENRCNFNILCMVVHYWYKLPKNRSDK